jgi:hypothetical protein
MADVFLSYKRDERAAIETIASRLRDLGLTVWFDASMSAGETFNDEIDREARAAKAVLVCWSPGARESRWVKAEAMIGFEQDKLAAAYVAGPDEFSAPTPFNTIHAEDLRAWLAAPSDTHSGWKSVLRRLGRLGGRVDIESWAALDAQATAAELRAWIARYRDCPLAPVAKDRLQAREDQDAERSRVERENRERRALELVEFSTSQAFPTADAKPNITRSEAGWRWFRWALVIVGITFASRLMAALTIGDSDAIVGTLIGFPLLGLIVGGLAYGLGWLLSKA